MHLSTWEPAKTKSTRFWYPTELGSFLVRSSWSIIWNVIRTIPTIHWFFPNKIICSTKRITKFLLIRPAQLIYRVKQIRFTKRFSFENIVLFDIWFGNKRLHLIYIFCRSLYLPNHFDSIIDLMNT